MATQHWPTYILVALYILAMIIVTIIAKSKNKKEDLSLESTSTNSSYTVVTTHFLASKNFNTFVLLLTTFASVFSGYTVVGMPNESGKIGFISIRWLSVIIMIGVSLLMIFPRLRRVSVIRLYESPGDFINDRYNSKLLCVLVTLSLCIPQLLYIAVQLYSLGSILSSFTDNELSFYAVISVASILILIFEFLGGMRSVAYTDTVQATVMILIFIAIPIVLGVKFGGFMGQVTNSEDLPCKNSNNDSTSGCLNYSNGPGNNIKEFYLRTPSTITIVNYILFCISVLSFSLNPHMLQRAMSAKHDWQIKLVIICLFMAAFLTMLPGLLDGITYISNYNDLKPEYQSFAAFQAMLAVFRDEGGFIAFISYIALLAGIAGIMSTADSALIGVSNTMSCDIFRNWLLPNASLQTIVLIGKLISFCTIGISFGISIYLYQTDADYAVIGVLQGGILWQAFPAYIFGLYTNIETKSILFGIIMGLICEIIAISLMFSGNDPLVASNPSLINLDKAWLSLACVAINLIVCGMCQLFCKNNNEITYDQVDNDTLSIGKIREIMDGINEPLTKYYGLFVYLTGFMLLIAVCHWIGEIDPELVEQFGLDNVKALPYNGKITNVIVGFPSWAFATLIWCIIACICGIFAASFWTVDVKKEYKQTVPTDSNGSLAMERITTNATE
eukprot:233995_1